MRLRMGKFNDKSTYVFIGNPVFTFDLIVWRDGNDWYAVVFLTKSHLHTRIPCQNLCLADSVFVKCRMPTDNDIAAKRCINNFQMLDGKVAVYIAL